ncbi:MAG: hypothetical protein KUG68_11695 [Flavobacteriaceae bacterium]|nr:hypothetical protein [Flavobacteriaceae bacterium]
MKKAVLFILLSIIFYPVFSQSEKFNYRLSVRTIDMQQLNGFEGMYDESRSNIEGSPYANNDFMLGSIYQNEKVLKNNLLLRYNIYSDEIEIKENKNSKEYSALIKNQDYTIVIDERIYVSIPLNGSEENGNYFNVLVPEGRFKLYKKSSISFQKAKPAVTSYDRDRPAKFTTLNTFYLVDHNGKFYELPSKSSKFYKVFKEKSSNLKSFAKKGKINIKKEKDLIRLINYYNSLFK